MASRILIVLVLATALPADAQSPFESALGLKRIHDLQLSVDGERLAFVVTDPLSPDGSDDDVWVLDHAGGTPQQAAGGPAPDYAPRWSSDGRSLAFLSQRSGSSRVYRLTVWGGEPEPLTPEEFKVQSFELAPDGQKLAFIAPQPPGDDGGEESDAWVVSAEGRATPLWMIDLSSGAIRRLTREPWRVAEYVWSIDGSHLYAIAANRPQTSIYSYGIYSIALEPREPKLISRPRGRFGLLRLSPDGSRLGYVGPRDGEPVAHDLHLQDVSGGRSRNISAESIDRPIDDFHWLSDGSLIALAQTGFTDSFYSVDSHEAARVLRAHGTGSRSAFAAAGQTIAYVSETALRPPEIWISRNGGAPVRVSSLNADTSERPLVEPELVHYQSLDGLEIEAALLRPQSIDTTGRAPAVIMLHGGPTWRWNDSYHPLGQALAARGFAVLYPNVRGSTGYGYEFQYMNRRDWGGGDLDDVLAGLLYLVGARIADPARVGLWGRSYGGYLAAWAITQTDRFQAAVLVAPMTNLVSEFGTTTAAAAIYDAWFLGTPYQSIDLYIERSPVTHVAKALTPTLITCGERDPVNPPGQCREFHRGLLEHGVESQLVIYPGASHRFQELAHQIDALERTIAWFERWFE